MTTVQEATDIIFRHLYTPKETTVPLREANGRVLAAPVRADRDLPPFDRVAMDGIALRYADWAAGTRAFSIAGVQAAGTDPLTLGPGDVCVEVMTGAVLPRGADTVVRYEDTEIKAGRATVGDVKLQQGQSIHHRGADARQGAVLLPPGAVLSPAEVAVLASVGMTDVPVRMGPRAAVISTGDELVDTTEQPGPFQIRRSNSEALLAALRATGVEATSFHLPDDRRLIEEALTRLVRTHDVLLLSGGVSRGKFDYVPDALAHAGIRKLFHRVSQRPGKPFWFGVHDSGTAAFALPGNPVSTFMCFCRYVRPWLCASMGVQASPCSAVLAADYSFAPPLTCFLQVRVTVENGRVEAWPVPGGGSGDFANLSQVDGFLELPLEKSSFKAGEAYPLIAFRP